MSTPEPGAEPAAAPVPLRRAYRDLPRAQREALKYVVALLCGVLLMPLLIWVAGNRVLGPYTHGENLHAGPGALLGDFLRALLHASPIFWAVALGPVLLLLLTRLFRALWRRLP